MLFGGCREKGRLAQISWRRAAVLALAVTAAICWGLLIWHAWAKYARTGWFNSDAATEMLYARHMAQMGKLLPGDWYFTTEVRLLHNSLIMAPLFWLTQDFRLVHTLAVGMITALQYVAVLAFFRVLRLSWAGAMLGGLLALCPVSLSSFDYFQSTMYYSFFLLCTLAALCFALTPPGAGRSGAVLTAAGCALSFAMGVCGIRYLEICFVPLACMAGVRIVQNGLVKRQAWKERWLQVLMCISGAAGYLTVTLLQKAGRFPAGQQTVKLSPLEQWPQKLGQTLQAMFGAYYGGGVTAALFCLILAACVPVLF